MVNPGKAGGKLKEEGGVRGKCVEPGVAGTGGACFYGGGALESGLF